MSQAISVLQSLTFGQPLVLWLFVLAVPVVLLAPWGRLRTTRRALRVGVLGVRTVVVGLLLLGLAEPRLRPAGHARAVVFGIDVSDSISPDQQAWARDWVDRAIRALPPGSHADTIEFAERAQLVGAPELPPGGSTDLSAALKLAGTLLPRDRTAAPEVVLLTDGWQTAASTPADALPSGVAVSYVPVPASAQRPLAVVHRVDAPSAAREGDRIDVTVDLQAAVPVDARLRLWLDQIP